MDPLMFLEILRSFKCFAAYPTWVGFQWCMDWFIVRCDPKDNTQQNRDSPRK